MSARTQFNPGSFTALEVHVSLLSCRSSAMCQFDIASKALCENTVVVWAKLKEGDLFDLFERFMQLLCLRKINRQW